MKCKDCFVYRDNWCSSTNDSPDPDIERECGFFEPKELTDLPLERALRMARQWSQGFPITVRAGEARAYHALCARLIEEELRRQGNAG